MRILIDLQAAQSSGSRNRGIGRYSLALTKAMLRQNSGHEFILVLNGAYSETVEPLRESFRGLLPQENIRVWHCLTAVGSFDETNGWRRQSMEVVREAFIANLNPDFILVSSLFEGYGDDAVTSVNTFVKQSLTAVILYDLIPWIYPSLYLDKPDVYQWYVDKVEHLKNANLLLSISESSRQEAINHLGISDSRICNVSGDADAMFLRKPVDDVLRARIKKHYCLKKPFLMYTGGIDERKNIDGLIRAFAKVTNIVREQYQLVIVCSAQLESIKKLESLIFEQGLSKDDVVFTGFVSDDDLVSLYSLCDLFVFPSWHEGFGLPVLEAMRCGAPVIAASSSSLLEIVCLKEALFDPHSTESMARAIERGLVDMDYRKRLLLNGQKQSLQFSWDESARKALSAMQLQFAKKEQSFDTQLSTIHKRPRLAYVSPFSPERTGIADYSAELLPFLAKHYEIDLIVDQKNIDDCDHNGSFLIKDVKWFLDHYRDYDRVLYHFGNSHYHQYMFSLLDLISGVVVLHDFYLSGVLRHLEINQSMTHCWSMELYRSHGYWALKERYEVAEDEDVMWRYPCSGGVIQESVGMIVHSRNSVALAKKWYPKLKPNWQIIPHLRVPKKQNKNYECREKLDFNKSDFIVCSFGVLGPTKLNHRLLQAWLNSDLAANSSCKLIFVGENSKTYYGHELSEIISSANVASPILITGWADSRQYLQYLEIADVGVQLRTLSRGETSGTVLDCLNFGVATIVNAHGSMADLDRNAVLTLDDCFSDHELTQSLELLWRNSEMREGLAKRGEEYIKAVHNPLTCALEYSKAIEYFYADQACRVDAVITALPKETADTSNADFINLAQVIDFNIPPSLLENQLFLDISAFIDKEISLLKGDSSRILLEYLLQNSPSGYRVEPVYWTKGIGFQYARSYTLRLLQCERLALSDELINAQIYDILLIPIADPVLYHQNVTSVKNLQNTGMPVIAMLWNEGINRTNLTEHQFRQSLLPIISCVDSVLCSSPDQIELFKSLSKNENALNKNPPIDYFVMQADQPHNLSSSETAYVESLSLKIKLEQSIRQIYSNDATK